MKPELKKLLILNAPYLLFVYIFDKIGQAVRLSPGADLSGKLLSIGSGFSAAFSNALPSFAMIRFEFLIADDLFDPGNDLFFGEHISRKSQVVGIAGISPVSYTHLFPLINKLFNTLIK